MRESRKCLGCDGTGDEPRPYNGLPYSCGACNGSGRVTDRVPMSDALADAETLRKNTHPNEYTGHSLPSYAGDSGERAVRLGMMCDDEYARTMFSLRPTPRGIAQSRNRAVKQWSLAAARAAFRAVPGLRGE